jgi:hypothetical protein
MSTDNVRFPSFTAEVRALLGQKVRCSLGDNTIIQGTLLGFGEGGDFEIQDEATGFIHYCWPLLTIEAVE